MPEAFGLVARAPRQSSGVCREIFRKPGRRAGRPEPRPVCRETQRQPGPAARFARPLAAHAGSAALLDGYSPSRLGPARRGAKSGPRLLLFRYQAPDRMAAWPHQASGPSDAAGGRVRPVAAAAGFGKCYRQTVRPRSRIVGDSSSNCCVVHSNRTASSTGPLLAALPAKPGLPTAIA